MIAASHQPMPSSQPAYGIPRLDPDERDLVERMRLGEQRAFDQFFATYAARLAAFAARRSSLDEAALEDVVQTTLVNAMRSLATFRGGSSLYTWLCQICRNQLADARRQATRRPKALSLDQPEIAKSCEIVARLTDSRDPLEECATDSTSAAVRQAVNQLPSSYAHILELRFGDELTVPQIARLLKLSEDAAESRLVRARQAFRKAWSAGQQPATCE
jgi:RNA polymerase sigma-70 factor, ECF subfamily